MNELTAPTDTRGITPEAIKELAAAAIIPPNTPPEQLIIFMRICQEKGLSPASKQIYLIPYKAKEGGNWVNKYHTVVSIDGVRSIAARSGVHAGTDPIVFNNGMSLDECIDSGINAPRSATCTIYKIVAGHRVPFTHQVAWSEFVALGRDKQPVAKWRTMPFQMLSKCAEMHAIKKAFPEETSGLHVREEEGSFNNSYTVSYPSVKTGNKKGPEEMTPTHPNWNKCKEAIASGDYTIADVKGKYSITNENAAALCQ